MAGDAEYSPRLTAALVVISAAQLLVVLGATIITVALPSIQRSLHFSAANLEWVISGYTLAFGGLLLLGGPLGDVFGRRRMFRSASAPHQECRRPTWALPLRS
jgi:MFS family permease